MTRTNAGGATEELLQKANEEITSMKLTVAELEKERDFYFGKLRDVEIACQVCMCVCVLMCICPWNFSGKKEWA